MLAGFEKIIEERIRVAHYLPPEIELRKEIKQTEDLLAGIKDTEEKYRVLKKINFLIMRLNTERNRSIMNEMPQQYLSKLAEHIRSKPLTHKKNKKVFGNTLNKVSSLNR